MTSKITGGTTTLLFNALVLNKYDVKYYRCDDTGFIQTEDPYWLAEACSSAITRLDIGLPQRNNQLADKLSPTSKSNCNARLLHFPTGDGLCIYYLNKIAQ